MKIAVVTPVFPPYRGGMGTIAYHHARLLAGQGQSVSVFTPNYGYSPAPDHPPTPSLIKEGEVILLEPKLKYGNAAWVPQLERQLRGFDAVILQYPFFGGMRAVYRAKKKYGFKLILNYNMDVVGSGLKGLVFWYATAFFLPRIINAADAVLASSEDYARHSDLRRFWSDDKKFRVIPIGVDFERFTFNPAPRENIVLFVGGLDRAHYFKGVEYLIKAFSLVARPPLGPLLNTRGEVRLVIAGKGELAEQYKKLAQELGVSGRVNFAGGVSDEELMKLYQTAAVTVLPSIDQSESFGIVLAESMAAGTPVITSNLPGVRSVYEDGVSGITVPIKDEQALAAAISTVLADPSKRAVMGKAARALAEKRYNWDSIGKQLLALCGGS
ncbi:MAG: glycosyltransferase family 4 protein [Parcubacteria group bacterium]|nr:glycosyltransferase family 4 protein [Parcubacteria group bacterium]